MTVRRSIVAGSGSYLPEKIVTNADLAKIVDTSDEWIVERSGISERRMAADGETTSDLAVKAAEAAMAAAGVAVVVAAAAVPFFPTTFLPPFNEGTLLIGLRLNPGVTLAETSALAECGPLECRIRMSAQQRCIAYAHSDNGQASGCFATGFA